MSWTLAMVNAFYHPYTGGTEKHMYELSRRLAKKHNVVVITARLEGTEAYEEMDGVRIHRIGAKFYRLPHLYPPPMVVSRGLEEEMERLNREYAFDFVNLHGRWFPSYAKSIKIAGERGIRSVLTLHNGRPEGIDPLTTIAGKIYESTIGKPVLRRADRIIAVSEGVKREIARYGISPEKFTVIHNGVDFRRISENTERARKRGTKNETKRILYMGRLVRQKGLDVLLKSMKTVVKEFPHVRLTIAGEGAQKKTLEKLSRTLGLEGSVAFPGFLKDEDVWKAYASSDLFVLSSLTEPFGMVLVEAMAAGLPCIGTDAGGIPEIIREGENGFIVPKGDPDALANRIIRMIKDEEMRRKMAENARKTAELFDWDIIAEKTERFYTEWHEG